VSIQTLVTVTLHRWPCRVQVGSEFTSDLIFVSPDDEHDVLETCRELNIQINT
jgi:hypothetical protein